MRVSRVVGLVSSRRATEATVPPSHHPWAFVVDRFLDLLKANGLFAISEISKAVVIIGFGDFATADAVGEFVASAGPSAARVGYFATWTFRANPDDDPSMMVRVVESEEFLHMRKVLFASQRKRGK